MHIPGATNTSSGSNVTKLAEQAKNALTGSSTNNSTTGGNATDSNTGYNTGSTGNQAGYNTTSSTTQSTTSSSAPLSDNKQKISQFLGRDGQADTTVHETINPAVEHEHISKAQREERQKIIDREIHQEHHHTTVQPIVDREVAPTTHTNRVEGVETREIQHGNDARVREKLEQERAQFRSTKDVAPTQITETTGPTVAGEHIHHHVHENIQPVIERDIRQEHVVHTTKPVHEIHQNESIHHTASTLPPVDISTFQGQGGNLQGRQERVDAFQGAPKPIDSQGNHSLGGPGAKGSTTVTNNEGGAGNIQQSTMGSTTMSGGQNNNASTTGTAMNDNSLSTGAGSGNMGQKSSGLGRTAPGTGLGQSSTGGGGAGTGSSSTAGGIAGTSGVGGASAGMAGGATKGTTGMKNASGERGGMGDNNLGNNSGSGLGNDARSAEQQGGKKASLVDKLNPAKDSTGKGHPGFMH